MEKALKIDTGVVSDLNNKIYLDKFNELKSKNLFVEYNMFYPIYNILKDNNFHEEKLTELEKYIYPTYCFSYNFIKNSRTGIMKRDVKIFNIYKEIIADKSLFLLVKKIMELEIIKNYYKNPVFYTEKDMYNQNLIFKKINGIDIQYEIEAVDESLESEYTYFMDKIFDENFFQKYIVLCELGENKRAFTNKFMRIFLNYLPDNIIFLNTFCDLIYDEIKEEELKTVSNLFIK